jgi:hypothetical protein
MTHYSAVLFVHVVSALTLAAALGLEALTLVRLQRATTSGEARFCMDFAPGLPLMTIGSGLFLMLSGGYLTAQMSAWTMAWPKLAVAILVLTAPLGAATGRRMRAIRRACASNETNESDLLGRLRDPFLKFSLNIRIALVLGIVLLMTAKPELPESLGIIGVFAILGFASALLFWRRDTAPPVVSGARE